MKKKRRWLILVPLILIGACLLTVGASALSNVGLPKQSPHPEMIDAEQEYLLAEVTHMRQTLAGQVWNGWDQVDIPLIAYNEQYAFLVDHPRPGSGWIKVPDTTVRGGPWEPVPGKAYYRQPVTNADREIGAFTVRVGDHMVAAFGTWHWARIGLVRGIRQEIPVPLNQVAPYRVVLALLMGRHGDYLAAYEHEAFHAFQALVAPERFMRAEGVASMEGQYPFDDSDLEELYAAEVKLLHTALKTQDEARMRDLVRQWSAQREARWTHMSAELVEYERQREWLEGLAKYSEMTLMLAAAESDYDPLPPGEVDFDGYDSYPRYYQGQVGQVGRAESQNSEGRFYYTGMAQALLLDRLAPGWKADIWNEGGWLDDLLTRAAEGG